MGIGKVHVDGNAEKGGDTRHTVWGLGKQGLFDSGARRISGNSAEIKKATGLTSTCREILHMPESMGKFFRY